MIFCVNMVGNFREFVDTMREISDYFESEGDKSTALEYVQHTADVCRSCGDVSLECDIELMLGQVYERIDDVGWKKDILKKYIFWFSSFAFSLSLLFYFSPSRIIRLERTCS